MKSTPTARGFAPALSKRTLVTSVSSLMSRWYFREPSEFFALAVAWTNSRGPTRTPSLTEVGTWYRPSAASQVGRSAFMSLNRTWPSPATVDRISPTKLRPMAEAAETMTVRSFRSFVLCAE